VGNSDEAGGRPVRRDGPTSIRSTCQRAMMNSWGRGLLHFPKAGALSSHCLFQIARSVGNVLSTLANKR
jgi:hypothetical protein